MATQIIKKTIKIEAVYGSNFQQELCEKMIRMMLIAWKTSAQERHQKNTISVKLNGESI